MIRIISDSAADLDYAFTEAHNVEVVPLYITFDGEKYFKDRDEVDTREFYRRMVEEHAYPKSSLPSVDDYCQVFNKFLAQGDEVICVCITNTLSGSYNSARTAFQMIQEEMPDAPIRVYDSWQDTISQSLLVREMVRMRDDGLTFGQMVDKMDALIASGRIFFTVGSLEYLQKGGRIGKLLLHMSSKLSIKPILVLDRGVLGLGGVCRSRKNAKKAVLEYCKKYFADNNLNVNDYVFSVGYGYDKEEGEEFRRDFEDFMGVTCLERSEPHPTQIGAITACHTGPHALGITIVAKYETL